MQDRLQELRRAFARFQNIPFPEDSDDEAASDLHAELAEYDGYVAGLITTLLDGGRVPPEQLEFDADLKRRAEEIVRLGQDPAAADARAYLNYLEELEKVLHVARASLD